MKKRSLILFLICIFTLCCALALVACDHDGDDNNNDTLPEDDGNGLHYWWADDEHTAYFVDGIDTEDIKDIVVPSTYKGKPVVSIGWRVFDHEGIETVTISEGIKSINSEAFGECINLKNVYLPNSIESIDRTAFAKCPSLEKTVENGVTYVGNKDNAYVVALGPHSSITENEYQFNENTLVIAEEAFSDCREIDTLSLPSKLHTIGSLAFYNANKLTSVDLPGSLKRIGDWAFRYCDISTFEIPANLEYVGENICTARENLSVKGEGALKAVNNCVINIAKKELLLGCENSVIPADGSVTSIGQFAFAGSGLTQITIPASVKTIGSGAFSYCGALETVEFNEGLECIEHRAFEWCQRLTNVVLPQSLSEMGTYAFQNCNALTSIAIPRNVTEISSCLFRGCKNLAEVTLHSDLTKIDNAFEDCDLKNVVIPRSVKYIWMSAFYNNRNLETVTFENTQGWQAFEVIDDTGTPVDLSDPVRNAEMFISDGDDRIGDYLKIVG